MEKRGPKGGGSCAYPTNTQHNQISSAADQECLVREQDIFMPIANVVRLMRRMLPVQAKISVDARETMQECLSEFISFVTSEANVRCQRERRKTITAEDVLWAMNNLGFDDYIEPLTFYLNRFREVENGDCGPLRSDPLVRMSSEHRAKGVATGFTPTYYMGTHSGIPWAMTPEGFQKDAQNARGTSGARVSSLDP